MNILLINHYAGSTEHGMDYRPYYLAREWVRQGHSVCIVAASYAHVRTVQPVLKGNRRDELIDGIHYTWIRTPRYFGNGLDRVRNMGVFVLRLFFEARPLVDSFKPDIVVAASTYPMDIWPAHRIAKLAGAKLVFEVHDLWPLTPMELGGMSKWHPFIMLAKMAEGYAYAHADGVVSTLSKAQDYMVSRGMRSDKFHYIPNGINLDEWSGSSCLPLDMSQTLDKLKGKGLPLVGYAGGHGVANALDVLLDAAGLLSGKIIIVLVGDGSERERLRLRIESEGLENVIMLPTIAKIEIPAFLDAIDIAYIGCQESPLYRFGISPTKLMDYMMAAKPVVHAVDAGNDPVAEAKCGITVRPENAQAIATAMMQLMAMSPTELKQIGKNGRSHILREQTYKVLAKKFENVLFDLLSPTDVLNHE